MICSVIFLTLALNITSSLVHIWYSLLHQLLCISNKMLVGLNLSRYLHRMFFIFSYVSRVHYKDSAKHVILGTQQFKPIEFASQINLNMDNAWGILRCIIDTCMKLKEGKYLIMKDPNKVIDIKLVKH